VLHTWYEWVGTYTGVVYLTVAALPLAALVVLALALRRRANGTAHAWRMSLAEVGMVYGTVKAYQIVSPTTKHFGGSLAGIPGLGDMGYIAMTAFVLNVVVAVVLTVVLQLLKVSNGSDSTRTSDYYADAGDPRVNQDLEEHGGVAAGDIK